MFGINFGPKKQEGGASGGHEEQNFSGQTEQERGLYTQIAELKMKRRQAAGDPSQVQSLQSQINYLQSKLQDLVNFRISASGKEDQPREI